jgi:hypothetical protein
VIRLSHQCLWTCDGGLSRSEGVWGASRLRTHASVPAPHCGFTDLHPRSFSANQSLRASLRRMCRLVFSSGGAPVSGRPESTKYIGSADQLLGSQWNRAVLAVLGS